jgi:TPR repeat protein
MKSMQKSVVLGISGVVVCAFLIVWQINKMRVSRALAKDAQTYQLNAQRGDAAAEEMLGTMYSMGHGVPQDYNKAFQLCRKSAEQGNVKAQYDVGMMYELGHGVQQDYLEALHWYRQAANGNNADAQCSIGSMYYYGRGVQRDPVQSYYWYRKAADKGYESAERALGFKSSIIGIGTLVELLMLFGYLWVLKDTRLSNLTYRVWDIPAYNLAALLGLIYVGLGIVRLFAVFHTLRAVNLYSFIEYLFLGTSIAVAFNIVTQPPSALMPALGIVIALFVGVNGFVHTLGGIAPFSPLLRGLSSANGILVGIIISITACLWIIRARRPLRL